jgi:hypothetical protein
MRRPAMKPALAKRVMTHTQGCQVTRRVEDRIPVRFTKGVVP